MSPFLTSSKFKAHTRVTHNCTPPLPDYIAPSDVHNIASYSSQEKKTCKAFVWRTYNIYEHCKQFSLVIDIDKPTQHVHRSCTEDHQSKQTLNLNNNNQITCFVRLQDLDIVFSEGLYSLIYTDSQIRRSASWSLVVRISIEKLLLICSLLISTC